MEGLSQNQESNKTSTEILGEHLAGKTEAELTPEEKEAEEKFCKENFKKFLDWMNNDEIFVHAISARDKGVLKSVLEKGILSREQLIKSGMGNVGNDRPFQGSGRLEGWKIINQYLEIRKKFDESIIDENEFEMEKNKIIETAPKIGRARVAHFLNKIIPSVIEEVGYPTLLIDKSFDRHFIRNRHVRSDSLGIRDGLTKSPDPIKYSSEQDENTNIWGSLPIVMSGEDLVSSPSSQYMKKDFINKKGFFRSEMSSGVSIYFKTPHELRQYELGVDEGKEERNRGDVAISNRISPSSFRVMRFGTYDENARVLYLGNITPDDISEISKLEEKGLVLVDNNLAPIPPLKSIGTKPSDEIAYYKLPGHHYISPSNHPSENANTIEKVRDEIKEGKIDMSLEEFEDSLKNNHLLNVMLSNQQKSLAMIEEMGGVKYEDTEKVTM